MNAKFQIVRVYVILCGQNLILRLIFRIDIREKKMKSYIQS